MRPLSRDPTDITDTHRRLAPMSCPRGVLPFADLVTAAVAHSKECSAASRCSERFAVDLSVSEVGLGIGPIVADPKMYGVRADAVEGCVWEWLCHAPVARFSAHRGQLSRRRKVGRTPGLAA